MNMRSFGFAGALLLVLLGCASGFQTESAAAPGADIPAYASFGWLPAGDGSEGATEAPLAIAHANVHAAIRTQLVEKGYREVEVDPDFRIGFEAAAARCPSAPRA
jgi:hypothetical protein